MLPEQQQRIMGYFIEEAKDHLNTIEQGLLNLQVTIEDPELVNEVFRAAHSVKGGAAMLGLTSIQQTSHRLEDSFKILKECRVKVDQQLESLFLRIFDTLQGLLEQLSGPFGLTEELGEQMVRELEPVFQELHNHLGALVGYRVGDSDDITLLAEPAGVMDEASFAASSESFLGSGFGVDALESHQGSMRLVFESDVPARMREMLQEFKQPESEESRRRLRSICGNLRLAGEEFNLNCWIGLIEAGSRAIANRENSYRVLAPVVIKDIKQAQDLVISGMESEIVVGAKLRELAQIVTSEADFEDLLAFAQPGANAGDITGEDEVWDLVRAEENSSAELMRPTISGLSIDELFDKLDSGESNDYGSGRSPQFGDSPGFGDSELETGAFRVSSRTGPEVGAAELNTLADLFDGESPDLDGGWEGEDEIEETSSSRIQSRGLLGMDDEDSSADFTDLLLDDYDVASSGVNTVPPIEDLTSLFGSDVLGRDESASSEESPSLKHGDLTTDNAVTVKKDRSPNQAVVDGLRSDDALGTLLDEVAAQTSVTADDVDLDSFSESEASEDMDLSELLDFTDDLFLEEDQNIEKKGDRDLADQETHNPEIDNLFNMTPDSDLDISEDDHWLEDAFGVEEESLSLGEDSSQSDEDLDALFGSVSLDAVGQSEQIKERLSSAGVKSQEAADLVELFDSVPTGIDDYGEDLEEVNTEDWLNFEEDSQSWSGDLESVLDGPVMTPSDNHLTTETMATEGSADDNSDFDSSNTFDLLEDVFGEVTVSSADVVSTLKSGDLEKSSTDITDSSFDEGGADLFDALSIDLTADDDAEDDLFNTLETEISSGDLEALSASLDDDSFEENAELLALETGATLDSADLDGFDDLLDSIDAGPLVTSELPTGFWDTEEPSEGSEFDTESLSGFFNSEVANLEDTEESFDDLESLLNLGGTSAIIAAAQLTNQSPVTTEVFSDLEEMLSESKTVPEISLPTRATRTATNASQHGLDADFRDLEALLDEPKEGTRQGEANITSRPGGIRPKGPRQGFGDQTMRVPVKQLDNLSNLMGELVVNRNSLEQDQERMRQFLDNLLHQVTLLSDVSQRTQDFYERSLLEIALLANRQGHRSAWRSEEQSQHQRDGAWKPEEMDRFTPFHSLAQEIIELIVRVRESAADIEFLVDEADQVTRQLRQVTTQLQEGLTRARMKPFAETTDRLFRAVREIGIKCGKQAQLQVEGKDILIDKMIVDQLYDPMTHLVNNAIAHGIEVPEVRLAAGKSAMGRITIRAFHQGNQTVISVSDDGAGIDPQKVKAKAIKQGLLTAAQAQRMARAEVYELLFKPGFSTQEQATDISGRGVGMDVVLTSLQEIRGTVSIDSTIGKGTVFTIRLPLVLSISKALCCISDRARIAFPMDGVEDMIDVPRDQVTTGVDGLPCIDWRGTILPFRPLRDLLAYHRHLGRGSVYGFNTDDDMISVIVLRSGGTFLAVQVDQVSTEQEIVIKQLEGPVPKPIGIAGATVLGDGKIVAIADVLELIDLATGRLRKDAGGTLWEGDRVPLEPIEEKAEPTVLIVDDSITVRSLLSITFEKSGYRVEEARDGKEAWEKMKSGLPCDIVFCDIEMPRMDGLELLSRMQKDAVLCELPIAMLTSRGADRHRQMAYSLGAKGYFTKPYLEEQLLDAAARMLKGEVVGAPAVV
ncbi:response regulator [Tychonema sp. BBK16]|uniref:hybrid sensor histidine kinase/response regulator n=1 Tax=Tychonema sp. BBK16 TaxID=2699888 RepID=UPI001F242F7F|nr:response regulator [Tychonema sp. BBK16]MCF6373245.1 response regulator [Tychonema sp. BBK16]